MSRSPVDEDCPGAFTARPFDRRSFLSLAALAAAGACAPKGLKPSGARAFDWKLSPASTAGMSEAGLDAVRAAVQQQIDNGIISGAVSAIARHGKLIYYEAQGFADPVARTPMRKDAIFRVMSSTKPVTAFAVLTLVDEGKLSLDDKVSKYIPSFGQPRVAVAPPGNTDPAKVKIVPADRELVIRDLLTHTSGITNSGFDPSAGAAGLVNSIKREPTDTLETYVPRMGQSLLQFQPGTKFAYSPTDAFDVALYIVQLVSGMPADVYMQERVFAPLDMVDTHFKVPDAKRPRLVDIFSIKDGHWSKTPDILEMLAPPAYLSGGGGLRSTVHDFMNFEVMLLNRGSFNGRQIVRPETVSMMNRNHVGRLFADWLPAWTKNNGFGLAVRIAEEGNINGRTPGAFGWGGAYGTESWAEPALDLAGVFFIQMNPPPFGASGPFEKAARAAIVGYTTGRP